MHNYTTCMYNLYVTIKIILHLASSIFVSSLALCPDLVDPVNGTVMMTGNSVGDTATYSCDDGFALSGVIMVTCQDDGQWSDPPPTCVAFRTCAIIQYCIVIIHY